MSRLLNNNRRLPRSLVRPQLSLIKQQTRYVSRQVWDCFGFLKDGTDLYKRQSCAYWYMKNRTRSRIMWLTITFGPWFTMFYMHGVWDFLIRRRSIIPLEIDYSQEFPWRPPENYVNPLFAPGRKYGAIRQKKREDRESKPYHMPWPYHGNNHD